MSAKENQSHKQISGTRSDHAINDNRNQKMGVKLPRLSEELKSRVENRISKFEKESEAAVLQGRDGTVPRITTRDYLIVGAIGVILTLYFTGAVLLV